MTLVLGVFTLSATPYCNTSPPVAPAVYLQWTASNGATSYDVYRNGSLYYSGVSGTTFDNTVNVVAGQSYSYYILARNNTGSLQSNTVNVTVPSNICVTRTLTTTSLNPSSGVYIAVTPSDNIGNSSGYTTFYRYYADNASVQLTASPYASGNPFQYWQMETGYQTTSQVINVTMNSDHTLTAVYATPPYTISCSASPSGGGTTSGCGTFNSGQQITVVATPSSGWTFVNWTEGGSQVSTNANYTFTVTGNRTLVANFTQQQYTISCSASPSGGGTTSGCGTFNSGQQITVVATPSSGWTFVNWTEGGSQVSTNANYTFTVTGNRTLVANFTQQPGALSVTSADGLSSSGNQGGPFNPPSKDYTLTNTGGTSLNWTATKGQNWVSLSSPTSGTLVAGGTATLTVSINSNANSLSPSTYNDNVTFTNTTSGTSTSRAVSLTVNALPGTLSVTPADGLSSSGNQGGPFSPSSKDYTLTNTGGTSLNWTATKGQNWVSLSSPTSGTLVAGRIATVTVSINSNANSLSPSTYNDNVTFTNTTSGTSTTRAVSLTVNAPPGALSVTPADGLTSSGNQGGPFSPSSKDYTLTNTGGTSLNWTATKGQNWVSLSSPTSGTLVAGGTATLTVSINSNANSLSPSTYNDNVTFTNTTSGSSTTRAISVTVLSPPPITIPVSPTNGGTVTTLRPTLQVQLLSGLNQYEFRVYQGATIVRTGTSGSNAWTLDIDLQNGSTYSWDCRAHNSAGWGQYFSPRWTFNVSASPSTTIKLKFPLDYYTPYTAPTSAIFDHYLTGQEYTPDETIISFANDTAKKGYTNPACSSYDLYMQRTKQNFDKTNSKLGKIISYVSINACNPNKLKYLSYDNHPGYDYAVADKDVFAIAVGEVIFKNYLSGYGNTLKIKHNNNYESWYAHLSQFLVDKGDKVEKNQKIAISGKSGTGSPHLHFGLKLNGKWVDPYGWYAPEDIPDPYLYKNSGTVNRNLWEEQPNPTIVSTLLRKTQPSRSKHLSLSSTTSDFYIEIDFIHDFNCDSLLHFEIIREDSSGIQQSIFTPGMFQS